MKEIIQEILEAEKTARERVEAVREKAKEIRLKAEKDADTLLSEAREKGRRDARALLGKTEKGAQKEKEQMLQTAAQSGESILPRDGNTGEDIFEGLYRMLIGED
jgi:vacuolar-type H+-ATPase subunit H